LIQISERHTDVPQINQEQQWGVCLNLDKRIYAYTTTLVTNRYVHASVYVHQSIKQSIN